MCAETVVRCPIRRVFLQKTVFPPIMNAVVFLLPNADLIAQNGDGLVFIEVKQSSSFDQAVQHVSPRQMKRLYASAEEYLAQMPNGSLTDVRFDVALVNGRGEVQVIENAFGHG